MNQDSHIAKPPENIILVGFMGSGKSTIGRELSKLLSYPLVDTDQQIVDQEKLSVADIFSLNGEEYFRNCESEVLRQLIDQHTTHHIIATGGGLPMRPENQALLRQLGYVVWLDARIDTILHRTAHTSHRPLLQTPNPRSTIESMLNLRNSIYQGVSHIRIQTSDLNIGESTHGILESARYFFGHA